MSESLPIAWPANGLYLEAPDGSQPEGTTREAVNVTTRDAGTEKMRGGSRPGISKLTAEQAPGGRPIEVMGTVVQDIPRLTYHQVGQSDTHPVFSTVLANIEPGATIYSVRNHLGRWYALTSGGSIYRFSAKDGSVIDSFSLPGGDDVAFLPAVSMSIDETGSIYVAGIKNAGQSGRIWRLRRLPRRLGFLDIDWDLDLTDASPLALEIRSGNLYVLTLSSSQYQLRRYTSVLRAAPVRRWTVDVPNNSFQLDVTKGGVVYVASGATPTPSVSKYRPDGTEVWKFEGSGVGMGVASDEDWNVYCIGKKSGGSHVVARRLFDAGSTYSTNAGIRSTSNFTLASGNALNGETITVGVRVYTLLSVLTGAPDEILIAATNALTIANISAAMEHAAGGGVNYSSDTEIHEDVQGVNAGGGVLTANARVAGAEGNLIQVSTTCANGSWGSSTLLGGADGDGAWTWEHTAADPYTNPTEVRVDPIGKDMFVALKSSVWTQTLQKFDGRSGTELFRVQIAEESAQEGFTLDFHDKDIAYRTPKVRGPRFLYLGTQQGSTGRKKTLYRVVLVDGDDNLGPDANVRQHIQVGVSNGNIITFEIGQAPAIPTGGAAVFRAGSPYTQMVVLYGKAYLTDGYNIYRYNPDGYDEVPRLDKVELWEAERGTMPAFPRILIAWNGRFGGGRFADDPHNWFLSAKENPDDFELTHVEPTVLDAVAGNDGRTATGPFPDVLNAWIPAGNDLAIAGGDKSIYLLRGDPGDNGRFDRLPIDIGILYGSAWCRDNNGNIYWQGTDGSFYIHPPGGIPQRISQGIDPELHKLDLGSYKSGMIWDNDRKGMHVFFMRRSGTSTASVRHFFWERSSAWWAVKMKTPTKQPSSIALFDGDLPSDRKVALGCEDGWVRQIDDSSITDDGDPFESSILIGPVSVAEPGYASRVFGFRVALASGFGGCYYDWMIADSPSGTKRVVQGGFLTPGQNPILPGRAKGNWVWLRLRSASTGQRWAYEKGSLRIAPAGRSRV